MSQILLGSHKLADMVKKLAKDVDQALPQEDLVLVGLMDGAMIFASDFLREFFHLGRNPVFESLTLSSYGDEQTSSGRVRCLKDIVRPIAGKTVLILDDVYESGLTLDYAKRYIENLDAKAVYTCVFARKPYDNPAGDPPDFVAWEAPDKFLIGYGLDDKGMHRGQPFISNL